MGSETQLYPRNHPVNGPDVVINNNAGYVQGIAQTPFNTGLNAPGISTEGLLALVDPSGKFISWVGSQGLLTAGIGANLLGALVLNQQGQVLMDQGGNAFYFQ